MGSGMSFHFACGNLVCRRQVNWVGCLDFNNLGGEKVTNLQLFRQENQRRRLCEVTATGLTT